MNGNWSDLNAINQRHNNLLKQGQQARRDRTRLEAQHPQHKGLRLRDRISYRWAVIGMLASLVRRV